MTIRNLLAITAMMAAPCIHALGQGRKVTGKVLDPLGEPLIGVTVEVVGTKPAVLTITDLDGNYAVNVDEKHKAVRFTYVGMEPHTAELAPGQVVLNVNMKEMYNQLDQVVVTGYAQTTTKKMTGSVGVMDAVKIMEQPVITIDAALQGQLAGVAVTTTSGQPGRSQEIRIRGSSTLSDNNFGSNASPLWVVDGVPLQGETPNLYKNELKAAGFDNLFIDGIGSINPNDIENITVLKDAAASAIYGSRASNGVIVITTKHGSQGRMQVNYSANLQMTMAPLRSAALMDSGEKIAWEQELWDEYAAGRFAAGAAHVPIVGIVGMVRAGKYPFQDMAGDAAAQDNYLKNLSSESTDWFKVVTRNAVSTNHHISLSGGTKENNYYISFGYTHNDGTMKKDNYSRYNIKANYLTVAAKDRLKLNLGVDMSHQDSRSPNLTSVDPFAYAYYANPYEKPYNEDGSYRNDLTYGNLSAINGDDYTQTDSRGFSILREIDHTSSATLDYSSSARLQADLKIFDFLHLVGLASYSFSNTRTDKIILPDTNAAFMDRFMSYQNEMYFGSLSTNDANRTSYITRAHLSFTKEFAGKHTVSSLLGTEVRASDSKSVYRKGYGYDPNTGTTTIPVPANGQTSATYMNEVIALNGDYYTKSRYASFYFSTDYFYAGKYIVNFSVRNDGSSYFGSARQFFPTWSTGAAWNIHEEDFMDFSRKWLSHLTFRVATGFTGNINNGVSPQLIMSYKEQTYREEGGKRYPLGRFNSAPNPNLRWEKTRDYKASADFGLFEERVNVLVEVYNRLSKDVVYTSDIPTLTGFASQKYNSVNMQNRGIELTVSGVLVRKKDFALNATANFAYNANKITRLKTSSEFNVNSRYVEGYPANSIFAGLLQGIDPYTGLYKFELRPDAVLNVPQDLNDPNNYRVFLGTSEPPYNGGFSLKAAYRNLSLSVSGIYSFGCRTYEDTSAPVSYATLRNKGNNANRPLTFYNDLYKNHLNVTKDRTDRWKHAGDKNAKYPLIYDAWAGDGIDYSQTNPTSSNIVGGAYLQDNSYLRVKTIMFSWSMSKKALSRSFLDSLRINLSLNNFFTWTNYVGLDPEAPGATYPQSKAMTLGVVGGF